MSAISKLVADMGAADTEYHWGWYGRMVGSYFLDHPGINDPYPNVQPMFCMLEAVAMHQLNFLPSGWKRTDEWVNT